MSRLLADENFAFRTIEVLRSLGHDYISVKDMGLANLRVSDPVIFNLAINLDRAVLTFDRDFIPLHKRYPDHAGIIVCRQDLDRAALAHRIHVDIEQAGSLHGKLIRVNRPHR